MLEIHSGLSSGSAPPFVRVLCSFSRLRVILCWLQSRSNLMRFHRNDAGLRVATSFFVTTGSASVAVGGHSCQFVRRCLARTGGDFSPKGNLNRPPLSPNLQFISGTLFWNARSTRARLMRGRVHANTERLWIERPPLKTELIPFEVRGKRGKHSISL